MEPADKHENPATQLEDFRYPLRSALQLTASPGVIYMSALVSEPPTTAEPSAKNSQSSSAPARARIAGCGFLMGAADIVPGVSGGTVALILGVYERLVTAISRCDATTLRLVIKRDFRGAADRIDLPFVAALGAGILCGIAGLASLMNFLLTHHRTPTFAAFSGMILASSLLVGKRIRRIESAHIILLVVGIAVALRIVTLNALQNPPDAHWYLFLCGTIGITAMILPGISGAFILLLLGQYHTITEHIKGIVHGHIELEVLIALTVFACGCLTGLIGFSRVLKWLLATHHDGTMAVLCGFMMGSLYKLWPFQVDTTPEVEKIRHKIFENVMPASFDSQVLLTIVLAVAGCAMVLGLDWVSSRGAESTTEPDRP